jgi:hypothetical protein
MTRARPRRTCCAALSCLPEQARRSRRVALRADAGSFAGALARTTRDEHIGLAIGAERIGPLCRLLPGLAACPRPHGQVGCYMAGADTA